MNDGGGIPGQHDTTGAWGGPQRPVYLPPVGNTPDWDELARRNEREDSRRRTLKIVGGSVGVLVVGGIVAGALALQQPGGTKTLAGAPASSPSGTTGVSASATPSRSASPSPPPSPAPSAPSAAPGRLDDRAGHHPVSLSPGAVVGPTEGHSGPTLVLNSSPEAYGQADGAVVNTGKSFTVSALVRNNAPSGGRSVISQGSESYYSFDLGRDYWAGHNQWVFKVQTASGGQDNTTYQAFSKGPATTGRWTLLTGVYDASAEKISLYVDGQLAQSTAVKGIWHTNGPLQLGRVRYKSAWSDSWDGAISDVEVWDQALRAARIAQLGAAGSSVGVPPTAGWLLP